jgi:ParB family chromosome partitioning protein
MTSTTAPFHLLRASDRINARGKPGKDGIAELAMSIQQKGLIQPLAVRPHKPDYGHGNPNGFYEIIDGRRRYEAIKSLIEAKAPGWMAQTEIPVLVRPEDDDADALESSLIANTVRLPMHPVDQHEVFARLADHGKTTAEIAARFGIAEKTVRQHLALARLAPEVRKAWRKGTIDAKTAQAFTLARSHAVQAATLAKLKKQHALSEYRVRSELTQDRPRVDSPLVEIVGLDAYLAAGGTVSESLFEEDRYIDDAALLRKLAADRMEEKRRQLIAEGWAWVALDDELPDDWRWEWERLGRYGDLPLTAEEERRRFELLTLPEDDDGAAEAEIAALEEAALARLFTPDVRSRCGVVIEVNHDGSFDVIRGVVRPGDAPDLALAADSESDDEPTSSEEPLHHEPDDDDSDTERPKISSALLESLTTTLTLAAQRTLEKVPLLALRIAVAGLEATRWGDPVKLSAAGYGHIDRDEDFAASLARIAEVPETDLWLRFARLVAAALDLRLYNTYADRSYIETLRDALPGEPYLATARQLFNAVDYFARATKSIAEAAIEEMDGQVARGGRKSEVAAYAAQRAKERGWLPPELRHPEYALVTAAQPAPDEAPRERRRRSRVELPA